MNEEDRIELGAAIGLVAFIDENGGGPRRAATKAAPEEELVPLGKKTRFDPRHGQFSWVERRSLGWVAWLH